MITGFAAYLVWAGLGLLLIALGCGAGALSALMWIIVYRYWRHPEDWK